ncbi:BTB/POZ domain-containing protein 6-B-like [Paramacrobiotus metropolitanus]|uniref:BTB/POZ domain-containing protein 6-B-like n=1 Tax=Paramacrobiotus metropolitanus TaxID=2943436 RepID=UPI0024457AC0|nr:BTB/POZ domain-containing protein 6-B-like [Paramacrobiotus metropolitanus]
MSRTRKTSSATIVERDAVSSGIRKTLHAALSSGDLSDVQLAVGHDYGPAKLFPAHKTILSMCSPVFRAMFYGSLPENCDRPIDVPDVHPEAFANMLSYLYSDRVDLNQENVLSTLYCADRYDLPLLVDVCSHFVVSDLDASSCLKYLDLTVKLHVESVVEPCLMIIDAHTETVLLLEPFSLLDKETLKLILQRDTLQASETDIYMAVERWAAAACGRNNEEPTATNRRRMLDELLFLVRFPLMSDKELLDGPAASGLLLPPELWDLYQCKYATTQPAIPFSAHPRRGASRTGLTHLPDQSLSVLVTVVLRRGSDGSLGFTTGTGNLTGRYGSFAEDHLIFLQKIIAGGSAYQDGRLQHGDRIFRVNGEEVVSYDHAINMIRNTGNFVVLDILRDNPLCFSNH